MRRGRKEERDALLNERKEVNLEQFALFEGRRRGVRPACFFAIERGMRYLDPMNPLQLLKLRFLSYS